MYYFLVIFSIQREITLHIFSFLSIFQKDTCKNGSNRNKFITHFFCITVSFIYGKIKRNFSLEIHVIHGMGVNVENLIMDFVSILPWLSNSMPNFIHSKFLTAFTLTNALLSLQMSSSLFYFNL